MYSEVQILLPVHTISNTQGDLDFNLLNLVVFLEVVK